MAETETPGSRSLEALLALLSDKEAFEAKHEELKAAERRALAAVAEADRVKQRETNVTLRERSLDEREKLLAERETKVAAREAAVKAAEDRSVALATEHAIRAAKLRQREGEIALDRQRADAETAGLRRETTEHNAAAQRAREAAEKSHEEADRRLARLKLFAEEIAR